MTDKTVTTEKLWNSWPNVINDEISIISNNGPVTTCVTTESLYRAFRERFLQELFEFGAFDDATTQAPARKYNI